MTSQAFAIGHGLGTNILVKEQRSPSNSCVYNGVGTHAPAGAAPPQHFDGMLGEHKQPKTSTTTPPTAKHVLYAPGVPLTDPHPLPHHKLVTDAGGLATICGFNVSAALELKRGQKNAPLLDDSACCLDPVILPAALDESRRGSSDSEGPTGAADIVGSEARLSCR